jgi:hypothetical protein
MSASGLLTPTSKVVSQSIAATGAGTAFALPFAEGYYASLLVTTSQGTVDVALQDSPDSGTTWRTLPLKFTQSASSSATTSYGLAFKPAIGLSDAAAVATPALTGTAVATNMPFNIKYVRPYVTLGSAGTTVLSITFTMTPKGNVVQ